MNDINCYKHMEDLEEQDLKQESEDLHSVYLNYFIDYDEIEYKLAYAYFIQKYGYIPNCFPQL